jgi:HEAT repeat protein
VISLLTPDSTGRQIQETGNTLSEIEGWREALGHADPETRAAAAENLCYAGSDACSACTQLVTACADDEAVLTWAVAALEEMGPPPADSLAELKKLACSENELVAFWAVTLVGRLESAAADAEPLLVQLLEESPSLAVRQKAAWALGKTNARSDAAVEALKRASQSEDARLARLAEDATNH